MVRKLWMTLLMITAGAFSGGCGTVPGPVDSSAPTEFTTTETGLRYRILRDSDGRRPSPSQQVKVHYRGWLDDGTEFDSSYKRGQPAEFGLNSVIPAWTEGLRLLGEGGMMELDVPPELGYGARGSGEIPPNARLHFLVELLEIR